MTRNNYMVNSNSQRFEFFGLSYQNTHGHLDKSLKPQNSY